MHRQRTLRYKISCAGIGLHSGNMVRLALEPAPSDFGIVFERTDLPGKPRIKVSPEVILSSDHATTIGSNGARIGTVEHLLAALQGLGIDNALVKVDADEVPIMDGSAAPFVFLIKSAGFRVLPKSKKFYIVKKSFTVRDGSRYIEVNPSRKLRISSAIDFAHPLIEKQHYNFDFSVTAFEREISRARTFGFLHEVEMLKKKGLAKGGNLNNAIVVGRFKVLNEDGLRFPDEFVRHKVLDQLGDLALVGAPVIAHLTAYKSGHALNHRVALEIASRPELVKVVDFDESYEAEEIRDAVGAWRLPEWATA